MMSVSPEPRATHARRAPSPATTKYLPPHSRLSRPRHPDPARRPVDYKSSLPRAMANLGYALAAASTAFRVVAYVFLEVVRLISLGRRHNYQPIDPQIPHSKAKYVLAFLYVTYLALYGNQQPPVDPSPEEHSNGEAKAPVPSDEKEKKDVKVESEDAKPLPPVSVFSGSVRERQQQLMDWTGPFTT